MRVLDEMDELGLRAAEAARRAEWKAFARYCEDRSRGARKQSLAALGEFIRQAQAWSAGDRRDFVAWLLGKTEQSRAGPRDRAFDYSSSALTPNPLMTQLVEPTLREWVDDQPDDAQVRLWLGRLRVGEYIDHLRRAIRLDPTREDARRLLYGHGMRNIGFHQHEMPHLYITDPREDLRWLEELEEVVRPSADVEWRAAALAEVADARRLAHQWLEAHPEPGDFAVH